MVEARRQKRTPPLLTRRHVPSSIARKCDASRAKCRTALLMTKSAEESGKLFASTGSARKFESGRRGARDRASRLLKKWVFSRAVCVGEDSSSGKRRFLRGE